MTEILPGELTHTDIIIDYEQRLNRMLALPVMR